MMKAKTIVFDMDGTSKEVCYIGDSKYDISLFDFVGLSIIVKSKDNQLNANYLIKNLEEAINILNQAI